MLGKRVDVKKKRFEWEVKWLGYDGTDEETARGHIRHGTLESPPALTSRHGTTEAPPTHRMMRHGGVAESRYTAASAIGQVDKEPASREARARRPPVRPTVDPARLPPPSASESQPVMRRSSTPVVQTGVSVDTFEHYEDDFAQEMNANVDGAPAREESARLSRASGSDTSKVRVSRLSESEVGTAPFMPIIRQPSQLNRERIRI